MRAHRYLHDNPTPILLFHISFREPLIHTRTWPTCHRRSPTCAKVEAPATKSAGKKPYGYWKHLPNVLSELEAFMSSLSPRSHTMPTAQELVLAGRQDLAGAIRRHTWRKVAAAANLPLSSLARPRSLNLSFCTQIRTKRIHPHMYWRDWNNVENEIREFIHLRTEENGHPDVEEAELTMPTIAELVEHGRSDLKRAISLHGGVWEVAKRMRLVPKSRPAKYWSYENVAQEVRRVMRCIGNSEDFPTIEDIRRYGERGLLSALRRFGGIRAVAKRMGLTIRRKSQKQHLSVINTDPS